MAPGARRTRSRRSRCPGRGPPRSRRVLYPTLFTLSIGGHGWDVASYRAAFVAAGFATALIAWALARRRGLPARRSLAVIAVAGLAVPVGGRAWHMVTNPSVYAADPVAALSLSPVGFAMFGAVLAAALSGLTAARVLRLDMWRLADAAAPALGVGIAIQRVGCFAAGCCFGRVTQGPLGVTYPPGSLSHLMQIAHGAVGLFERPLPVFPTQLFELAGALACAALALLVLAGRAPDGSAFLVFVGTFALVRWVNWGLRVPPDSLAAPAWVYPVLYATTIALCAVIGALRWRARRQAAGI
ncbi:MAG: hypothetical protein C0418_02025 [Coriobacteriaceae bacterium]|nr:hypothetical protein [Coriobacteriaceae bacterium]